MQTKSLKEDNADYGAEHEFWAELRNICLLPEQAAFNSSGKTLSCMNFFFPTTFVLFQWPIGKRGMLYRKFTKNLISLLW